MSARARPKLSIVTVCFNSAAHLEAALTSVAGQTWPNVEHIVIDGGSTDHTLAIIGRHRERLSVVVSEPDKGIYDAMNKGVARATGDYVGFLNSDDAYVDSEVLGLIAETARDDNYDAVFGDVSFFADAAPDRVVRRYDSSRFSPERLRDGWMMAHPALFVKRTVFDAVGPFKTDYRIAGDFEFIARAFKGGTLRYRHVPRTLVRMRLGGASTSGLKSLVRLNSEVLRACRENDIRSNWLRLALAKYPRKLLELGRR
jgi:glycosyltransferase involved in cell wall biosynthesis